MTPVRRLESEPTAGSIGGMVKPRARGRARPTTTPIATGLTLAQLTAETDRLIGTASYLDERLHTYRRGRDTAAAIKEPTRSQAKQEAMTAAAQRGAVTDGRWRLVCVGDRHPRRLSSEAVRRAHPTLWADSRPRAWSLTVHAGPQWSPVRVPAIRTATVDQLIESVRRDIDAANKAADAVEAARAELIAVYQAIEAARPWGGHLLVTDDGWVIGYRAVPTFNAGTCRALADARSIDLTPILTPVTIAGGWRVMRADADDHGDALGDAYAE